MMGVVMPSHFCNYLGLMTVFTGQTKSTPLRTAYKNWMDRSSAQLPEKKLIENITKIYQTKWELRKSQNNENVIIEEDFAFFIDATKLELIKKDVFMKNVKTIIKGIKQ